MSFALTTEQIRNRTKTVTRRKGWSKLKKGDLFWAVEKVRGLAKGEKVKRIALLRCVSNRVERLYEIMWADVSREGFPELTVDGFVRMFCHKIGGDARQLVQRIEFVYEEGDGDG